VLADLVLKFGCLSVKSTLVCISRFLNNSTADAVFVSSVVQARPTLIFLLLSVLIKSLAGEECQVHDTVLHYPLLLNVSCNENDSSLHIVRL
jgi:hypothetical protein